MSYASQAFHISSLKSHAQFRTGAPSGSPHRHTAKKEHEKLGDESHAILLKYHEDGKEPHPVAKMMASVKTGVKLTVQESDTAVAELITDGCDMGIKSLHHYLNQYPQAEECVVKLTGKLIDSEEKLRKNLQCYL